MNRRQLLSSLPLGLSATALSSCVGKTAMLEDRPRDNILHLKNQNMTLKLDPILGGSVRALRWHGHEILRPTAADVADVTQTSSFPLVPIVNRIPDGRFSFQGREIDLEGNFMGQLEFIHGYGWSNPWTVTEQGADFVEIGFYYQGGEWPWPFKATQKFTLEPNALRMELNVTNFGDSDMPADLGFHPYFPTTEGTLLFASYEGHWINDERGVSYKRVEGPFRQDFTNGGRPGGSVMTDQTHYGWNGPAVLKEIGRPDITITADETCQNLHIFYPPDGDFVALEPTLGRGNPFGILPREYRVLGPRESTSIWMRVGVG